MPRIFEDETVIIQSGGGGPTFTAPETVQRADRIVVPSAKLTDTINRSDRPVASAKLVETIQRADAHKLPSASFKAPETVARADLASFAVAWDVSPRSGTPDTDAWGDAWTNAGVGQTGVNHGNENPLDFTNSATGERRAFVEIDLTRFTGLTAVGSGAGFHVFRNYLFNAGLVAVTATLSFYAQAGRWFTESTIVQTNQPNPSPALVTKSISVPAGGSPVGSPDWCQLTAAEMNLLLGSWVLVKFTTPALTVGTVNVSSREGPGTSFTFYFYATR